MTLEYWHWIVLGIALVVLEIFIPSFTALWFGVAAVFIGIILAIAPDLPLVAQVLIWTASSVLLTWLWFKYLKPLSIDRTKAGLSKESIVGEVGQVLSIPIDGRKGLLRFPAPILGSDEWEFICADALAIGDRVRAIDVSGNALIVTKQG